jgi:hypothetical protein
VSLHPLVIPSEVEKSLASREKLNEIKRKQGVRVPEDAEAGDIVGVVDVVDCVQTHLSRWKLPDCWGWVLQNSRRRPFRRCKGAVGFVKFE